MANRKKKLTKAQWALLERVRRVGKDGLAIAASSQDVTHAGMLRARGWVENHGRHPYEFAITTAGLAALEERAERNDKDG
jgi:hypothetical protein